MQRQQESVAQIQTIVPVFRKQLDGWNTRRQLIESELSKHERLCGRKKNVVERYVNVKNQTYNWRNVPAFPRLGISAPAAYISRR